MTVYSKTRRHDVQDKLLKKIDGNRLLRSLREAYDQALDLEHKNQIMKRYEMSTQAHQIAECNICRAHRDGGSSQGGTRHSVPPVRRRGGFNYNDQLNSSTER